MVVFYSMVDEPAGLQCVAVVVVWAGDRDADTPWEGVMGSQRATSTICEA